jgi:hypothetical protein
MTREQQLIHDAVDVLIQANNKFIQYYEIIGPSSFKPHALHPAEECAIAYLQARIHLKRIASDLGLNVEPQLKAFMLCKTTDTSMGD